MTDFGTIESYDSGKGSGTIAPEQGGDALMFGKSDLKRESSVPLSGQRFSYETKQTVGGEAHATNLRQQDKADRPQDAQREQAQQQQG